MSALGDKRTLDAFFRKSAKGQKRTFIRSRGFCVQGAGNSSAQGVLCCLQLRARSRRNACQFSISQEITNRFCQICLPKRFSQAWQPKRGVFRTRVIAGDQQQLQIRPQDKCFLREFDTSHSGHREIRNQDIDLKAVFEESKSAIA